MGCCRSKAAKFPTTYPAQVAASCVNCRRSLRDEIKAAIDSVSSRLVNGTHRRIFEVTCTCGWKNKVAMTFNKN